MKIKDIPLLDRPRERVINNGVEKLTNEELLAIIIKNGTKNKSSKDIALELLNKFNGINNFKDISINQLLEINGIGQAKAVELLSSIELGRRIFLNEFSLNKIIFKNAKDIYINTKYLFENKKQECFYCFYLNNKNEVIERRLLFMGTINKSIVHPREVFKYAYLSSASSIVCVHNHPSGDLVPSKEDIRITNALVELGYINAIPLLDHVIVSDNGYYSFYDDNKIINM